jgi:hypothetical protein
VLRPARHRQLQDIACPRGRPASSSSRRAMNATPRAWRTPMPRRPGSFTLVSVHSGPGLTNALTGIGEAAKSRTPLLVLAWRRADRRGQIELLRRSGRDGALGRGRLGTHSHAGLRARGMRCAPLSGRLRDRQTVVLSLPTDVQDGPLGRQGRPARAAAGARAVASRSRERAPAGGCVFAAPERPARSRRSRRGACWERNRH